MKNNDRQDVQLIKLMHSAGGDIILAIMLVAAAWPGLV